jgi:hypothetical protein
MKNLLSAIVMLLFGSLLTPVVMAQTSVYAEFSAAKLQNLVSDNVLYGVTTGLLFDGPAVFHQHMVVGGDLQGEFVHRSNFSFDDVALGPRATFPLAHGIRPFAEFLVGFARLQNPLDQPQPSTDSTIQINGGVSKRIASHVDLIAQVGYSQCYAFGGEYNPKNFALGAIYHFGKR